MKTLQDALYNWLSIKVVADARSEDQAARDTSEMFFEMLQRDHHIENVEIEKDDIMYLVRFVQGNDTKQMKFPIELIDVMINQMEEEPEKFPNFKTGD